MSWTELLNLFNDPKFITMILLWTILYIVYLILFLPVLIWLIKTIYNIINQEEINLSDNLKYWFKRIWKSFKTYWYVFSYVALIPSIIFIIWWIINIAWYFYWWLLASIWWIILFLSMFYFVYSVIYKWLKAKFALYSAIDKNEFTKENFENSIKITKNNWWRIFCNLLVVWLLIIIFSLLITFIFSLLPNFSSFLLNSIFYWFLNNVVTTTYAVFAIIFTYLLFKRLELENSDSSVKKNINVVGDKNNEEVVERIEL
jgi:hypothetical protein